MTGLSFSQIQRIRFVAANYSRLQGLRGLPVGLLLFAVALWANWQHGPAPRPVFIPLVLCAVGVALYWLIDRYYRRAFGKVAPRPRGHLSDWVGLAGGALALAAFFIENAAHHLLFSPTGLVLAAGLLADYLLLVRETHIRYMPFWPLFSLLLVIISILPVFGLYGWWLAVGIQVQILAVMMASGLIYSIASVASHLYFVHWLPGEALDGGRI